MAYPAWLTIAAALALLPLPADEKAPVDNEQPSWRQPLLADLRPGDIVFRRGVGATADAVMLTSRSSGGGKWTHVGIVAQPEEDGPLYVVHAIDDRGVVVDTPERFFSHAEATAGASVRVKRGEEAARIAMSFVGRPFDASLSFSDQAALYCTELVFVSLARAGGRLDVPMRKLPLTGPVMFPDDLRRAMAG